MSRTRAIKNLRPGSPWMMDGESLAGLTWLDEATTPPTAEEIEAEVDRIRGADQVAARVEEIKAKLRDIDEKSIRPMVEGDSTYLAQLRAPVADLRAELRGLI